MGEEYLKAQLRKKQTGIATNAAIRGWLDVINAIWALSAGVHFLGGPTNTRISQLLDQVVGESVNCVSEDTREWPKSLGNSAAAN